MRAERPKEPAESVVMESRSAWRQWLKRNHARDAGVWLITFKKSSGKPRLTYDESVEEALCFGWIDSKPRKLDAERSMLWFAPRKAKSGWSKLNRERVERLLAEGKVMPAGLAKIEAAKRDGSWSKLESVDALIAPPALLQAFSRFPDAQRNFEAFPKSVQRGILEWISNAKRPETVARRVEEAARLAQGNERANAWRPK